MMKRCIKANPEKIRAIMKMRSPQNVKKMQKLTGKVATLNKFLARSSNTCERLFKSLKVADG